jgi:hypothetical protein
MRGKAREGKGGGGLSEFYLYIRESSAERAQYSAICFLTS